MKTLDGQPYYRPARLFPGFNEDDKDIAAVSIGEDLLVYVGHRDAVPGGNDANEHFTHAAVHIDVFDCDFNYLGSMGQFRDAGDAVAVLPAMIPVIQALYPSHVYGTEEDSP